MFNQLFPALASHLIDMIDRLARNPSNDSLKMLINISEAIILNNTGGEPNKKEVSSQVAGELRSCKDTDKNRFISKYPMLKRELEFYFYNKKDIDTLRIYIESSVVVKKVSGDFFKDMDN